MKSIKQIILILSIIRYFPLIILWQLSKSKSVIDFEIRHWRSCLNFSHNLLLSFIYLVGFKQEFRNLFYKRVGLTSKLFSWLYPPMPSLFITTPSHKIGKGLFIQHGFATIISAHEIGEHCWINQQVTIGFSNLTDAPILGNNVKIAAGAKVIGGVTLENNTIVGANAVVTKSVPANSTVVGIPAYILFKDGVKVNIKL